MASTIEDGSSNCGVVGWLEFVQNGDGLWVGVGVSTKERIESSLGWGVVALNSIPQFLGLLFKNRYLSMLPTIGLSDTWISGTIYGVPRGSATFSTIGLNKASLPTKRTEFSEKEFNLLPWQTPD